MTLQHTKNLLTFWNGKFNADDFNTLVTCVDKIAGNQQIGTNKFLLIISDNVKESTQLIMTIRNIVGLIHCQFLSNDIDTKNYRTKLFTSTCVNESLFGQIKQICSTEYRKLTLTNANVICIGSHNILLDISMQKRAIVINMI